MQTILGSSGIIGKEVAKELHRSFTKDIRLVSRNPKQVNPTDRNTLTGKEFLELSAKAFGVKPEFMAVKKWMLVMIGLFNPIIKESIEMIYQNEADYVFDSSKFEKAFNFKPTSYESGILETAKSYN